MQTLSRHTWTILAFVFANGAYAADESERGPDRRGPPPAALEACSASVDGDSCDFSGRKGKNVSGTCTIAKDEALACRPEGPPPRLRRRNESDGEDE